MPEEITSDSIKVEEILLDATLIEEINERTHYELAKEYLKDTSWIWEKYNRNVLVLQDMTNEEFKIKYKDIINKQEEYRFMINTYERKIGSL